MLKTAIKIFVSFSVIWILFIALLAHVEAKEFRHPGYPGILAQTTGWPVRFDNLFWDVCVPGKFEWFRWHSPTTIHLDWDVLNLPGAVKVLVSEVCPPRDFPSREADKKVGAPALPYIRVWSIGVPAGTPVDWYFGDTFIAQSYSQVAPRPGDPAHPYAVLTLAYDGNLDPSNYFAKVNGSFVGVWFEAVNSNGEVVRVIQRTP